MDKAYHEEVKAEKRGAQRRKYPDRLADGVDHLATAEARTETLVENMAGKTPTVTLLCPWI